MSLFVTLVHSAKCFVNAVFALEKLWANYGEVISDHSKYYNLLNASIAKSTPL